MKTITIAGNCGKDAETRTTQGGQKVTSVSIGVSHYDGRERSTIWFDVSMWGKRGETLAQFAKKGAKLVVSGDLSTREYNGKTYLQVNAQDFTPMGDRQQTGHADPARQAPAGGGYLDDEVPFMREDRA